MDMRPTNHLFLAALALAPVLVSCDDGVDTTTDDVTDIKNSAVKNQSIGNCWVYATIGWAESLHLTQTGKELNLSESYVTYWH
jgi:aminopeptidase C